MPFNANDTSIDLLSSLTTATIVVATPATFVSAYWNLSYDYTLFANASAHAYTSATIEVSLELFVIDNTSKQLLAHGGWNGPYDTVTASGPTGHYKNGTARGDRESTTVSVRLGTGAKVVLIAELNVRIDALSQGSGAGYSFAHWNLGFQGRHARLAALSFT